MTKRGGDRDFLLTLGTKTYSIREWCLLRKLNLYTVLARLRKGYPPNIILKKGILTGKPRYRKLIGTHYYNLEYPNFPSNPKPEILVEPCDENESNQ